MTYNKSDVLQLLEKAVAEKGESHEADAIYFDGEGHPVCIAANALVQVGLGELLTEGHTINDHLILRGPFTPGAIHLLFLAQIEQDRLHDWGSALRVAKENYDSVTEDGEFIDDQTDH